MPFEWLIRLSFFVLVALVLGLGETLWPRRPLPAGGRGRWTGNLGVAAVSTALVRLFPILPVGLAAWCEEQGYGLCNLLRLPEEATFVPMIVLLDAAIYFQHRAMHVWRPLWRLHRTHHADTFFDFTTAVRFHPFEIALSMLYKLILVAALGPSPGAVLVFEILLNALPMFNHANLGLPDAVDRALRLIVVTPDMHRVHHGVDPKEFNTNYGFCFPFWDRLFASYREQPAKGQTGMAIGLNILREPRFSRLMGILAIPFV